MAGWFGRLRFRVQILIFMFAIVLISLGVSALIAFPQARQAQYEIKLDRLLSTGQLKQTWVEQHFRTTRERVRVGGHTDLTVTALVQFAGGVREAEAAGGPAALADLRRRYADTAATTAPADAAPATATRDPTTLPAAAAARFDAVADVFDPLLRELATAFELDDVLLVRADEPFVVYTARKRAEFLRPLDSPDIASHIRRCAERVIAAPGTAADPALAFEDFAERPGATGERVACLGAPVFGEGLLVGVFVAVLPITPLNGIMLEQGESARRSATYLVGPDHLLRSGLRPGTKAGASPVIDHAGVRAALDGRSGHGVVDAGDGGRSLAVWFPVRIDEQGVSWALIAEMDEAEVYAPVNRNTLHLALWWGVMLVLLMAMAFVFSRRIDRAIRALLKRTRAVAAGADPAPLARGESSREFTELVDSFNHMTERIRERAIAAEREKRAAVEEREARLQASERRLLRQNEALVALAKIEPKHGPEEGDCVREVTRTAAETLSVARASVWFFDESGARLRCMQLHDRVGGCFDCGMELNTADFPAYFAALHAERIVAADDAWTDPRTQEMTEAYLRPKGIGAMLDAAIHAGGRTVGVVCFEHVGPPRPWHIDEQNFASALADLVALLKESMERDKAEAALAESRERLALTFTATNDAIWDVDLVHDRLVVNPRFYELCDVLPEALSRAAWVRCIHPDDWPPLEAAIGEHLAGQRPMLAVEFRQRARGGEYVWIQMRARIVSRTPDGAPARLVGTLSDVTDRRRALEAESERAAADEANKAKSQFLANMSHELRTPLNGVLGYAQILQRDPLMGPPQRECLEAIESCGQHLLTLINDVLDLSKIEAGRLDIRHEPCDLPQLLTDVGHVVRQRAEAKGLRFDLEMSPHVPRGVMTDATKLRQVLVNLLGNAVKFTTRGNVSLAIAPEADGRLRFAVHDSGIGIPADKLGEIFDAFKQTAAGVAAGGTGLGLAISRRIVEGLGGRLEVHSELGRGSTFFFSLPFVPSDAAQFAGTGVAALDSRREWRLAPGQRVRILIADDRPANRDILVRLLTAAGFETLQCENGQEAIELTRRERPDLVFMDVRMPVMDGLSATRVMRREPELRGTRIIAVTASVFPDAQRQAREAGCDDIIGKPFRAAEVFDKIERHLKVTFVEPRSAARANEALAGAPAVDGKAARPPLPPAEARALAQRLRAAAEIGSITALTALADELSAGGGPAAQYAAEIAQRANAFEFDALTHLAAVLEQPAPAAVES